MRRCTYNARKDNLTKAWRQLYGYQHGILVVNGFYENVACGWNAANWRPGEKEESVVLEFTPGAAAGRAGGVPVVGQPTRRW